MKTNKLLWVGGGLAVVLVVGYVAAEFALGAAVSAGVNSFGSSFTGGTTVSLGHARISPLTGTGTLDDFLVGNPKGWDGDRAFYFKEVHVDVAPLSILGDHIVVNEVTIDSPEFVYETKVFSSNIGDLLKAMEGNSTAKASADAAAPADASKKKALKFEVKRFRLTNGKVRLGVGPAAITLPMPPVSLDDLGTPQGGITPDEMATAIMRSVTGSVVQSTTQAAGKIGSTLGAAAGSGVGAATDALKGLFGGKK